MLAAGRNRHNICMKTTKLIKLCALSLSIFLLCSSAVTAQTTANPQPGQTYTNQEILQQLVKAKVVYLGETHDSAEDHQAQLKIIREMQRQNRKIAIAMEMFQRPFQSVIDNYLAGKLTEEQLVEANRVRSQMAFSLGILRPHFAVCQRKSTTRPRLKYTIRSNEKSCQSRFRKPHSGGKKAHSANIRNSH